MTMSLRQVKKANNQISWNVKLFLFNWSFFFLLLLIFPDGVGWTEDKGQEYSEAKHRGAAQRGRKFFQFRKTELKIKKEKKTFIQHEASNGTM